MKKLWKECEGLKEMFLLKQILRHGAGVIVLLLFQVEGAFL